MADQSEEAECPICFEPADDIAQLVHAVTNGDVSTHCACGTCRMRIKDNGLQCPFCRNDVIVDHVRSQLTDALAQSISSTADTGDAQPLAGLLETWLTFEMSSRQHMIQETSKELVMDPLFCNRLDKALNEHEPWLRDAFGVILRLYALIVDGDIQVPTIYSQRLHQCVERAFDTLKGMQRCHPHFIGAFYTQAITAYLCARNSDLSTGTLAAQARRAGEVCVEEFQRRYDNNQAKKYEALERLDISYVQAVSEGIWGSMEQDRIMQLFFA